MGATAPIGVLADARSTSSTAAALAGGPASTFDSALAARQRLPIETAYMSWSSTGSPPSLMRS
jgi:hypothetical protein